ncbi:MAG: hypothetical protein ACK4R9_11475 [Ignavibacterium sp.]
MLVFIDNCTGIGGYTSMVTNIALELYAKGIKCKILCSTTSVLYKNLNNLKIDFIQINPLEIGRLSKYIDEDDVIVSGILPLSILEELYSVNPFFCFYSLAPDILIRIQKDTDFLTKNSFNQLLFELNSKNGLYFMDGSGFSTVESFFKLKQFIPKYLPIPISQNNIINRYKIKDSCKIITYIGRGVKWKIFPVKKLILDLNKAGYSGEIHIITDSDNLFREMLDPILNEKIVIKYIIGLYGSSLDDYLIKYSDINVAMGMSALESAKLGIPTILVDMSYKDYPDSYFYRWLFQNNSTFNLGFLLEENIPNVGSPIDKILDSFKRKSYVSEISLSCFEYVYKNHSSKAVAEQFIRLSNNIEFKVNDFRKYNFFKYYVRRKKVSSFIKKHFLYLYLMLVKIYYRIKKIKNN